MTSIPDPQLRRELLDDYHRANEVFHRSREEWEHWLSSHASGQGERVDAARDRIRQAERELERVEDRIRQAFN